MSRRPKSPFRFSLKALLLLIAIVSVWMGFVVHRLRERQNLRAWIAQRPHSMMQTYDMPLRETAASDPEFYRVQVSKISPILCWMGDTPVYYINLVRTPADWQDRQRIAEAFPEAAVVPERPEGFHR